MRNTTCCQCGKTENQTMVLVSTEALVKNMEKARYSNTSLARAIRKSPATVGHLRSGQRMTTSQQTAQDIEHVLGFANGTLFHPKNQMKAA